MAFSMFKFHDSWIILLFALFVSFASCEEVRRYGDDDDWKWKRWTLDWNWTPPTFDQKTVLPPENDVRNFARSNSALKVIVFAVTAMAAILIFVCKTACKAACSDEDASSGSSTAHTTPRSSRPLVRAETENSRLVTSSARLARQAVPSHSSLLVPPLTTARVHNGTNYMSTFAANADVSSAFDKPPDYYTVVLNEQRDGRKPAVIKATESPPPEYDETFEPKI